MAGKEKVRKEQGAEPIEGEDRTAREKIIAKNRIQAQNKELEEFEAER